MDSFLVEMIVHVEQQYSEIERECLILRKLLKPWPKKKKINQENLSQIVKPAGGQETEGNSGLTASEKLALEEMDRLLNKAQKAIRIKEKVDVKERSNITNSNKVSLNDGIENAGQIKESNKDKIHSKKSENMTNGNADKGNKGKIVTQKRLVPSVKKNLHQSTAFAQPIAKELKSNQNASASNLSSSRTITPRPLSVTSNSSRPSSSRSRYTPAHVNAPFKTDMNTRVPHRKHNHLYKNHLNKGPHKKNTTVPLQRQQPSKLNDLKTLPKINSVLDKNNFENIKQDFDDNETDEDNKTVDDVNCKQRTESVLVPDFTDSLAQNIGNLKEDDFVYDKPKPEPMVTNHQLNKVSETEEQPSSKHEEVFSLKDKSTKIKIPQRLHKLVSENHTLLEKCSTAKLVKKVPNTDAALCFIERLNETNEVGQELWTKAKAMTCLQSHQLMLKYLNSLEIETMSEKTPFETVYRAKRFLEFILSKFAQTQDEADYFSKVQFRPTQSRKMAPSTSLLGDKDPITSLFSSTGSQNTKHKNDPLVTDALASSRAWTQLQFEKNLHHLHLHLLGLSQSEWWQTLCQDPEDGSMVQMIHSLLTSCGEFFPAIVKNPYS